MFAPETQDRDPGVTMVQGFSTRDTGNRDESPFATFFPDGIRERRQEMAPQGPSISPGVSPSDAVNVAVAE